MTPVLWDPACSSWGPGCSLPVAADAVQDSLAYFPYAALFLNIFVYSKTLNVK